MGARLTKLEVFQIEIYIYLLASAQKITPLKTNESDNPADISHPQSDVFLLDSSDMVASGHIDYPKKMRKNVCFSSFRVLYFA